MEYKIIEDQRITGTPGEQNVFENVEFINCNFKENLEGSEFIECRFDNCELDTELDGSRFYKCEIEKSRLDRYRRNTFNKIVFEKCEFFKSSIETNYSVNITFRKCRFLETNIKLRDISDSRIVNCYFRGCDVIFTEENDEYTASEIAPCTIIFNNFVECEFSYSQFPEYFENNNFIYGYFANCQFKKITSCSFYNCDLGEILFPGDSQYNDYRMCNFESSDFTNKDLSTCDFYENKYRAAIFNNTVFNKESSREILLLTEEQINGIIIKE